MLPNLTDVVFVSVELERQRQDNTQSKAVELTDISTDDGAKLAVLVEEVGEVSRAINDNESLSQLYTELVQVAAVAIAWAEAVYDLKSIEAFGGVVGDSKGS